MRQQTPKRRGGKGWVEVVYAAGPDSLWNFRHRVEIQLSRRRFREISSYPDYASALRAARAIAQTLGIEVRG